MHRSLLPMTAAIGVAIVATHAPPARAAESIDACTHFIDTLPTTITSPGVYCLRADLVLPDLGVGTAISMNATNVTIDCNGHRLTGPAPTLAIGGMGANQTVRRCTISGFRRAVFLASSGGMVEDNRVEGGQDQVIWVSGNGSTVRRNVITDTTGGSGTSPYSVVAIYAESGSGVVIEDNVINGVTSLSGSGRSVIGINVDMQDGATISGNHISGLSADFGFRSFGILKEHGAASIRGNSIFGPATALSIGISCSTEAVVRDNTVIAFETNADVRCHDGDGNVYAD